MTRWQTAIPLATEGLHYFALEDGGVSRKWLVLVGEPRYIAERLRELQKSVDEALRQVEPNV